MYREQVEEKYRQTDRDRQMGFRVTLREAVSMTKTERGQVKGKKEEGKKEELGKKRRAVGKTGGNVGKEGGRERVA